MTLLFLGSLLSSPQLEQAKSVCEAPAQSGQFVPLIEQKNLILPLASMSATRAQRTRTTSPRSLMSAVALSQVGTNSGATRKILRNRLRVADERFPRSSALAALRSIMIALPICLLMIPSASALVLRAVAKALVHSPAGPEKDLT